MPLNLRTSALLSVAAMLLLVGPAEGRAAPNDPYSLTVSPTRLILPAGQTHASHVFDVSNTGTKGLEVETTFSDITQGHSGILKFGPGGPFSATAWVRATPKDFHLRPGQHHKVTISINLPPNPEPGDHQVGVVFRVPPQKGKGNVGVSGAIGSEVLINVPGKAVYNIALGPLKAPLLSGGGPIPLKLTIGNSGNVHKDYIRPHALKAKVNGEEVQFPNFSVLRDSVRTVTTKWADPPLACLCALTVSTRDGQGHTVTAHARIFVFPFALVVGVLLTAIGLLLLSRAQRRRSRRRLAEARQEAYEQARRELETQKAEQEPVQASRR
jgi:hypothetical protein